MPTTTVKTAPPAARWLSTVEAAGRLGIAVSTLYTWRVTDYGPPAIKVGRRLLFREDQLDEWLDSQPVVWGASVRQSERPPRAS